MTDIQKIEFADMVLQYIASNTPLQDIQKHRVAKINPTLESILREVEKYTGLSLVMLKTKTRKENYVKARQIAVYLIWNKLNNIVYSKSTIGVIFNMHRTSIVNTLQVANHLINKDDSFNELITKIEKGIYK